MAAIVHLAGNQVRIGSYVIQRCLLCGTVLDEVRLDRMAVPDESHLGYPQLIVGGFYEVEGNRIGLVSISESSIFESDLDLPDNCCIRLSPVPRTEANPGLLEAQRDAWRAAGRYLYEVMGEGGKRGRPLDLLSKGDWGRILTMIGKAESLENAESG